MAHAQTLVKQEESYRKYFLLVVAFILLQPILFLVYTHFTKLTPHIENVHIVENQKTTPSTNKPILNQPIHVPDPFDDEDDVVVDHIRASTIPSNVANKYTPHTFNMENTYEQWWRTDASKSEKFPWTISPSGRMLSEHSDTTESLSDLHDLLKFKYDTLRNGKPSPMGELDAKLFSQLSHNLKNLVWPLKIYVYPFSEQEEDVHRFRESRRSTFLQFEYFFPHYYIDTYFFDILQFLKSTPDATHPLYKIENDIAKADLAFIPARTVSHYYSNLKGPEPIKFIATNQQAKQFISSSILSERSGHHALLLKNLEQHGNIPHFILDPYVCYRRFYHHIPRQVKILTFETVGATGEPSDSWYENGCQDRCLAIPYVNIFDWPGNNISTVFTKDYANIADWHAKNWMKRSNFLSFIGSFGRSTIIITHRARLVKQLQEKYGSSLFTWYQESWSTDSNIKTYSGSKFCLQLHGDTPTRNAFYESVTVGCIPVITEKSYLVYRAIFSYMIPVERIAVVIPNRYFEHANVEDVMNLLLHVERKESLERIELIYKLRNFWRYSNSTTQKLHNALSLALTTMAAKIPTQPPNVLYSPDQEKPLVFLDKTITKVYQWKPFPIIKLSHKDINVIRNEQKRKRIFVYGLAKLSTVEKSNITLARMQDMLTLEKKLIDRLRQEQLLVDSIELADMAFYPFFMTNILEFNMVNSFPVLSDIEKWKGLIVRSLATIKSANQKTTIMFFQSGSTLHSEHSNKLYHFLDEERQRLGLKLKIYSPDIYAIHNQRNMIGIPQLTFKNSAAMEGRQLLEFIHQRDNLICYSGDTSFYPTSIIEYKIQAEYPQLFQIIAPHLFGTCDFVAIPKGVYPTIFSAAIEHGSIPLILSDDESYYAGIFGGILDLNKLIIKVPQSVTNHMKSSFETYVNNLLMYTQSITFDERNNRKTYISEVRSLFNLSHKRHTEHGDFLDVLFSIQ